jgi:hypothetical protein
MIDIDEAGLNWSPRIEIGGKFQNIREQMPQESTRKEQDLSIC